MPDEQSFAGRQVRDAARDVLAPELAAVVEGEGTIDVVDARALAALLA